jgi:hypothetical protein
VSRPRQKWPRRRFSLGLCWLLSKLTMGTLRYRWEGKLRS